MKSDNKLTCEDRNVHRYCGGVWFIEANTKISLPTEKKQDEHTYVHQTNSSCKSRLTLLIFIRYNKLLFLFTFLAARCCRYLLMFFQLEELCNVDNAAVLKNQTLQDVLILRECKLEMTEFYLH